MGIFDRYFLQTKIGKGATAEVFLAQEIDTNLSVAIKLAHRDLCSREKFRIRWNKEVIYALNLQGNGIVPVLDHGEWSDGRLCYVMKYCSLGSFDKVLQNGNHSLYDILKWLSQTVDALNRLHGLGFIHQDVKADNFLLCNNGQMWLSDFGTTRPLSLIKTMPNQMMGTREWMAPEQRKKRLSCIGAWTDWYSFGQLLHLCVQQTPVYQKFLPLIRGMLSDNVVERPQGFEIKQFFTNVTKGVSDQLKKINVKTQTRFPLPDPVGGITLSPATTTFTEVTEQQLNVKMRHRSWIHVPKEIPYWPHLWSRMRFAAEKTTKTKKTQVVVVQSGRGVGKRRFVESFLCQLVQNGWSGCTISYDDSGKSRGYEDVVKEILAGDVLSQQDFCETWQRKLVAEYSVSRAQSVLLAKKLAAFCGAKNQDQRQDGLYFLCLHLLRTVDNGSCLIMHNPHESTNDDDGLALCESLFQSNLPVLIVITLDDHPEAQVALQRLKILGAEIYTPLVVPAIEYVQPKMQSWLQSQCSFIGESQDRLLMVMYFLQLNGWILPQGGINPCATLPDTWRQFIHRFLYLSTKGVAGEPRLWEVLRLISVAEQVLSYAQVVRYDEAGFGLLLASGLISMRGRWVWVDPDIRQLVCEHMSYQQKQVAHRSLKNLYHQERMQ